MYSPLFFSLYDSKLGLTPRKNYERLDRYREIAVKVLANVGQELAVCSLLTWC